eukprot:12995977-Alexandrium_andersonii.AAC.1
MALEPVSDKACAVSPSRTQELRTPASMIRDNAPRRFSTSSAPAWPRGPRETALPMPARASRSKRPGSAPIGGATESLSTYQASGANFHRAQEE